MRRRISTMVVIALVLVLGVSSEAAAYNLLGGKWSSVNSGHIQYWIYPSGADYTAYSTAVTSWNNTPTPIWIVSSGKADTENLSLTSVNNNSVGWDGYTYLSPCNTCTYTYSEVYLNDYYANGYSAGKRQSVTEHELGHVFGLAHPSSAGQAVLMNAYTCGTNSRWCTFGINTPQQDEINGINYLY
jgi:hypothetical protein